jgi:uncharacterized iron-regulated protein
MAACAPARFDWQGPRDDLGDYRTSFEEAAGTRLVASIPREELLRRLANERILWLGDFHTSSRLHGLQSELLDQLQRQGTPIVLLLEAIGEQDQRAVDRYLEGGISLQELRATAKARWDGSWLDDRDLDPAHYRSLLAFARRDGAPVLALEPTPRLPLSQRDEVIAAAVRDAALRHPERLLVVHVGQAHLAGQGDLVARTGLGGIVLGGEPPAELRSNSPPDRRHGAFAQSSGGLWWFVETFRAAAR